VLVGGQIALAFVLLIGGGLLAKSFLRLHRTDPGYDPAHLLVGTLQFGAHHSLTEFSTTRLSPEEGRLRDQRKYTFTHHALERIRALPGVTAAASSGLSPLDGSSGYFPLRVDGRPDEKRNVLVVHASPDYLRTMGLPLLRGEGFPAWDGVSEAERYHWAGGCPGAAQYCVAIVSETLARTVWPGDDPIGKRVGIYDCCVTVVGVVPDVRYRGVDDPVLSSEFDDRVQMYLPGTGPELLIRTTVEPTTLMDAVRAIVLDLAGEAVVDFTTLDRRQTVSLARPRFYAVLVGLFAAVAATLALVGLYGVIAYSVGRRTREIGLRMALGAERNDVRAMVLRQGMTPVAAGIVAGAAGALALGRLLAGLLYGMDPADPIVIGLLAAAMVLVSLGATYLPARRASNVALMDALRHE
jgi:putative ABC transport system permease protein